MTKDDKKRMTLAELAAQSASVSGQLKCPRCWSCDFRTYGTSHGVASTFRYKACRNCGHKIFTVQNPEVIIRSIETQEAATGDEDLEGDFL